MRERLHCVLLWAIRYLLGGRARNRQLPAPLQERVSSRAAELYREIRRTVADAAEPFTLRADDPLIDRIVDQAGNPPCPFLGDAGECLIYEHRPLSCCLEVVPMVE